MDSTFLDFGPILRDVLLQSSLLDMRGTHHASPKAVKEGIHTLTSSTELRGVAHRGQLSRSPTLTPGYTCIPMPYNGKHLGPLLCNSVESARHKLPMLPSGLNATCNSNPLDYEMQGR